MTMDPEALTQLLNNCRSHRCFRIPGPT